MADVQGEIPEELGELETVVADLEQQSAAKQDDAVAQDDDLPSEYRGKSIKDIVQIAESRKGIIGRQGNEIGEVRRLADELIKASLQPKPKEPEIQPEVDFFENPQEAIRRAVESNPTLQNAAQYAAMAKQELAKQKLQQLHPDYGTVMADEKFVEWVKASPIRLQLLKQADGYDVNAAHELFSTFKELNAVKQARTTEADDAPRKQALKAAAVDTGGAGETSRKIYRRADLMNLRIRNPAKYEAMYDEIMQAYAEGRVR